MRKLGLFVVALFLTFAVSPAAFAVEIQVEKISVASVEKKSSGSVSFKLQVQARNFDFEDSGADIQVKAVDQTGKTLIKVKVKGPIVGMAYNILTKEVSMPLKDYEAIESWKVISIRDW